MDMSAKFQSQNIVGSGKVNETFGVSSKCEGIKRSSALISKVAKLLSVLKHSVLRHLQTCSQLKTEAKISTKT